MWRPSWNISLPRCVAVTYDGNRADRRLYHIQVLELAGNVARESRAMRIKPRHVQLAVRRDGELDKVLAHVTIARGGVPPNIPAVLLSKTTSRHQRNDNGE